MIDDLPVKVDYAGRIILPKNVRRKFEIKENDRLLLSFDHDKIVLKKETFNKSFLKLVEKLEYLIESYTIDYLLCSEKIVLKTSSKYNSYMGEHISKKYIGATNDISFRTKSVLSKTSNLEAPHYCFYIDIDSYTTGIIFIIINDNRNKKEILSHLKMLV